MRKFIYQWNFGNNPKFIARRGFIVPNHYNHSLQTFRELAGEIKIDFKDFPESEIECSTIRNSSYMESHPVVSFSIPEKATDEKLKRLGYTLYPLNQKMDFNY